MLFGAQYKFEVPQCIPAFQVRSIRHSPGIAFIHAMNMIDAASRMIVAVRLTAYAETWQSMKASWIK